MAFQAGNIKLSGTFDDLSFYNSSFGWLVRRKGGPTRKQFKTSPAFARARENSSEFTTCAREAAILRRLISVHTGKKDKTLYHRLMKLMRLLANHDTLSLRGKRDPRKGMLTSEGLSLLRDFEVAGDCRLYDILLATGYLNRPGDNRMIQSPDQRTNSISGIRKRKKNLRTLSSPRKPRTLFDMTIRSSVPARAHKHTLINTAFG